MNVLILSKDRTMLAGTGAAGDARERHAAYLQCLRRRAPGSEIRVIVLARRGATDAIQDVTEGLRLYPTRSASRIAFLLSMLRTAREVMRDGWRPDVITGQEPWEEGLASLVLRAFHGGKVVTQLHFNIFSGEWLRESSLNRVKHWIARRVARHSDLLRVVSSPLQVLVTQRWGIDAGCVRVAPVGVTIDRNVPEAAGFLDRIAPKLKGRQIVLFVGRLCEQKNLAGWIEVARKVSARVPDSGFLIVGDGPQRSGIEEIIRNAGLEKRVALSGMLPYGEVSAAFSVSKVFLLTSHYEGFGRVVLEAMVCGVPVVSTCSAGPEDLIVDGATGYLVALGDTARAAECVVRLLTDGALAAKFAVAGNVRARDEFGVDALANRVVECWMEA